MTFKYLILPILLISISLFTGCFAPVNSTFESAKLLKNNDIELQGSYSGYYGGNEFININNNFGFGIAYGVSDNYNLKLRYERIVINHPFELFGDEIDIGGVHFLELSNKFSLVEDNIAIAVPFSLYLFDDEGGFLMFDPRLFFTIGNSNTFEFNIIPKAHIIFGGGFGFMPGLNLGIGLSSDLRKWAIRPEVGFDGYFTFGIGLSYYINSFN